MKIASISYEDRIIIARRLVILGARSHTLVQLLRLHAKHAREICQQIHQRMPASGQTPQKNTWFVHTHERKKHCAFLMLCHATCLHHFRNNPESVALSVLYTYQTYLRVSQKLVSIDRFVLLIQGKIPYQNILKQGSTCFSEDNMKIMFCRHCNRPFLIESYRLSYVCLDCS